MTLEGAGNPETQGDPPGETWLSGGRFAVLLGVMIFAAFPEVLLGTRTWFFRDFGTFTYPLAFFQRDCFWRGELPLWDPYSFFGVPFLAQWNTIALYPPALIYLIFPMPWSLGAFCLAHLFVAGMGMYWLTERWTHRRLAAAVAGVAFAFSGMALNGLMWHCNTAAFAWMPWVLLWVERAWNEGGRTLALATVVAALQMLAGSPEIVLLTWFVLGLILAGHIGRQHDARGRSLWRATWTVVLVSGLSAAQLLPFFECLRHSARYQRLDAAAYAMPPWGWANLLVPAFRCWRDPAGVLCQMDQDYTTSYYLGTGVLVLALWAGWRLRTRRVAMLATVFVGSLVLALGNHGHVYRWLSDLFPPLNLMRFPVKFAYLATLTGVLLAAFGLARLASDAPAPRTADRRSLLRLGLAVLLLIVSVACWAALRPVFWESWSTTARNALTRALVLTAFMVALVALVSPGRTAKPAWRNALALLLVALTWFDAITHCPRQNPTVAPDVYRPGLLDTLRDVRPAPRLGDARVLLRMRDVERVGQLAFADSATRYLSYRMALYLNCPLLDRIPSCFGVYPLYLRDSTAILGLLETTSSEERAAMADFVGAAWVNVPGKHDRWVRRPTSQPMITAGQTPRFLDPGETLRLLKTADFDPKETVCLPPEAHAALSATNLGKARVEAPVVQAQRLEFAVQTESDQPALVVVAQSHYPAWKAYVDGAPTPVWRANHAFQAIQVPPGRHRVLLRYEDAALRAGAIVSGLSLAVLLGLWFRPPALDRPTRREHRNKIEEDLLPEKE